jgi:hypothetical protein
MLCAAFVPAMSLDATAGAGGGKPRVIVLTDIGNEPEDSRVDGARGCKAP